MIKPPPTTKRKGYQTTTQLPMPPKRYLTPFSTPLPISDYSFYKKDQQGEVISPNVALIQSGTRVEVEAELRYFEGSKTLVLEVPLKQWTSKFGVSQIAG